jgi:integrase/recombinase XerD
VGGHHIEDFLKHLETKGQAETTRYLKRTQLHRFYSYLSRDNVIDPRSVTPEMIRRYDAYLMENTNPKTGKKRKAVTRIGYLGTLRQYFDYLADQKKIFMSPAAKIAPPKRITRLPKDIPTEEQMARIMEIPDVTTPRGIRERAILELLYSTGIRRRELVNLDVYDLNLTERTLMIRRGKGKKDRMIPVGKTACEWVKRYLDEVRFKPYGRIKRRRKYPGGSALFVTGRRNRLTQDFFIKFLRKIRKRIDPNMPLTCHTFRHAFATHMLRAGARLTYIQRILGHVKLETTEIYTHLIPEDLKKAHEKHHPRNILKIQ